MRTLIAALLVAVCSPLTAQTPYLVKDINSTTAPTDILSSSPNNFIRFGSRIFFSASTPSSGTELWSTDGTEAGTTQVADIYPGPASSFPTQFAVVNGNLLFNVGPSGAQELWATDGTAAGTHVIAAVSRYTRSKSDQLIVQGRMIFSAYAAPNGNELWTTDGTAAGTHLLKDLVPGPRDSNPNSFVLLNGTVYFSADGVSASDGALWKTDGTASGTVKVKSSLAITDLTMTTFGLFFMAFTETTERAPWVSDGSEAGTHPIGAAGAEWIYPSYATAFGDRVLFVAKDLNLGIELWISDGTAAGTHILRDINPGPSDAIRINPFITVVGDRAFFSALGSFGREIWKTDGTEAGTTQVPDIAPGSTSSNPFSLVALGDKVYFTAYKGTKLTLWVTDGAATGTHPVKEPYPVIGPSNNCGIIQQLLTVIDGNLYFSGDNGVNGAELWKSDGTAAGTTMIANLAVDSMPSGNPANITAAGDWVYFDAWDGSPPHSTAEGRSVSLWRSDGTPEGTLKLTDYPELPYGALGQTLLFNKGYPVSTIWSTKGTPESTAPAVALTKRFFSNPVFFYLLGDKLFASPPNLNYLEPQTPITFPMFAASLLSDAPAIDLGFSNNGYEQFVNFAGRIIYDNLVTTDGTATGTYKITTFADQATAGSVGELTVMAGSVFFLRRAEPGFVTTIWKTDGTFEGTTLVASLPSLRSVAYTTIAAGRNLFFIGDGQLWVTDGTQGGTHSLPARPFLSNLYEPLYYPAQWGISLGDRLMFAATDPIYGAELWTSDGTTGGTHIVADLYSGPTGSQPSQLESIGGLVYFSAKHDLFGNEPWVTDGTPAGTRMIADLEPGLGGSDPVSFVRAGNRIFFSATTKAFGRELWAMAVDPIPSVTVDDVRVTEGDGSEVIARFTVTLSSPSPKNVTVGYATENGSATAGVDYAAVSGALLFTPGDTMKSIDVPTHGNTLPEKNKTFFLTLHNPTGARLAKTEAFAIIEDDEQQISDVALSLDFSTITKSRVSANVTNNGPHGATGITVRTTATPSLSAVRCVPCTIFSLTSGTGVTAFAVDTSGKQRYLTATATADQRDPHPENNRVGWTTNNSMAMDALYLTPGSHSTVTFSITANVSNVFVVSSDPGIIAVSSDVPALGANSAAEVTVRGLQVGKASLLLFTNNTITSSLDVDVVATGTSPRWPGAVTSSNYESRVPFGQAALIGISFDGSAPYTGLKATGLVTISSKGRELGRVTLTSAMQVTSPSFYLPVYLPDVGDNPLTITYAGDENFLPMTLTSSVTGTIGAPAMTITSTRTGASVNVHVRVTGSPAAAPTGTLDITVPGTQIHSTGTLVTTAPGIAETDVTFPDATQTSHTVRIVYMGDSHYTSITRDAPTIDLRRHAASGR
jgi:ELWxxDGT repeat protein